jgi:hypothetical protein
MMFRPALKLASLLSAAMLAIAAHAEFQFETNNHGGITILRGECAETVAIPSEINGLPVTELGTYAFNNCLQLANVTIPSTLKTIGNQSFADCRGLTNVTIPAGVENIDQGAFYFCSSLTNVTIPGTVTNIGDSAFSYTALTNFTIPEGVRRIGHTAFALTPLTNVVIPASVGEIASTAFGLYLTGITVHPLNTSYVSRDGVLFNKGLDTLVIFPASKPGSYDIPGGVRTIADYAFWYARGLTNITIANTVTNIGESSFYGCENITSITIPRSVKTVGDMAFQSCTRLRYVFFEGDAPAITVRSFETTPKFYYLPGTTGWEQFTNTFPGLNASLTLWNAQPRADDANFGARNNQFGFNITGTPDIPVIVEGSTDLTNGSWTILQSGTLTNGSIYFSDSEWVNYPGRFYRIRSP